MPMLIVRGCGIYQNKQSLRHYRQILRETTVSIAELQLDGVQDVEVWFPSDLLDEQNELCIEVREMWRKTRRDKPAQDKLTHALAHEMRKLLGAHRRVFCFVSSPFDDKTQGYCLLEADLSS